MSIDDKDNIAAVIQCRMNSSRIPGKVLCQAGGKPLLQYLTENIRHCSSLGQIILATSLESSDDPVADFCLKMDMMCHRGPLMDVAKRFLEVVEIFKLDAFVRISGDSPFLDHRLVEDALTIYRNGKYDLVTNVLKRTFPKGQSVEIIRSKTYRMIYPLMVNSDEREHVTKYFYTHKDLFAIRNFESGDNYGAIQLSVDTPDDMRRFKTMVETMDRPHWTYTFRELIGRMPLVS
jgi:spore coat polysaccharide biosynthesis protein SpsF